MTWRAVSVRPWRADLIATREKNGIFLSQTSFDATEAERFTLRARTEELESAFALMKSEMAGPARDNA